MHVYIVGIKNLQSSVFVMPSLQAKESDLLVSDILLLL